MKIIDDKILDMGMDKFYTHPMLGKNLADAALDKLSKNNSAAFIYDYSLDKKFNQGMVLAMALALKDFIVKEFPNEKRIGIALPSGIPGIAVNLAVQMANKVSVNYNFTMGPEAAQACIDRVSLRCIIGSNKVREKVEAKMPNYPWTQNFYDIAEVLKKIGKAAIVKKLLKIKLLPTCLLKKLENIPTEGGDKEASVIFTSGSEGMPKAAILSHKNIMANCIQMDIIYIINKDDILHANLPLFHSFGQSIQLWFCCIFGHKQVAVQSPLEVAHNFDAMKKGGSTVLISTPTFLRSYLKKGNPEDAKSLYTVIAGAEKTPDGFMELWEKKFPNSHYKVGYGLTEASPVVSVNLYPDSPENEYRGFKPDTRANSVGQLWGGLQACIMSPETHEILPYGTDGILCLRGASIFGGYLNMPEQNAEKFKDGWLITGDIASLDRDGFIFIKGRLARFSKIGGEMVPHTLIEERIIKLLGQEDSEAPTIAIASREDENKGECLVLVASIDVDMQNLRHALALEGISNLWIPKVYKRIEKIPVLGAGKLDIASVQKIAREV